jgi:hypothetical protein
MMSRDAHGPVVGTDCTKRSFCDRECISGAAPPIAKVTLPPKKRAVTSVVGQGRGLQWGPKHDTFVAAKHAIKRSQALIIQISEVGPT